MVRRTRTAKGLGQRHDLSYFKRPGTLKRWRWYLSLVLPLAVIGWLGVQAIRSQETPYSHGKLSTAHSFLTNDCNACHGGSSFAGIRVGFKKEVDDPACQRCHQAPPHEVAQVKYTPNCSSCHLEHKGSPQLARVRDSECAQCHANLETRSRSTQYVSAIAGFNRNHPEFLILRTANADPGTIRFNHLGHIKRHGKDGILGPDGKNVTLTCEDCHKPFAEAQGPYKYGDPAYRPAAITLAPGQEVNKHADRELMAPIEYSKACQGCHVLQFDTRFSDAVPHKKPEIVHEFVVQKFKEYIAKHPDAIREQETKAAGEHQPLRGMERPPAPRNAEEWVNQRVAAAEQLLWKSKCGLCHQMEYPAGENAMPHIMPANITVRWMNNAFFSHESHRPIACASCHDQAEDSQSTAQVLIPGIKVCQRCHNEDSARGEATANDCFQCHQYHDWKSYKEFNGKYHMPNATWLKEREMPGGEAKSLASLN